MLDFPKLAAKRISQKYGLDEEAGLVCLTFYNWDEEKLCANLELSVTEAFERCGYLKHTSSATELATCMVCNELAVTNLYACGHSFCKVCFTGYFEEMIKAKKILLVCPYNSCNKHLPPLVVSDFLSAELSFDLKEYTLRSFVDSRPNLTWCGYDPCCCLISHRNCPKGTVINCFQCNSKLRFNANGKAHLYDDCSLTREGLEASAKKRNRWWLLSRDDYDYDDHDFAHLDKRLR